MKLFYLPVLPSAQKKTKTALAYGS